VTNPTEMFPINKLGQETESFAKMQSDESPGTMKLLRESGAQLYRLTKAHWGVNTDREYGIPVIWIVMQAENLPSIFPEDDNWPHGPEWTIEVWAPNIGPNTLRPGTSVAIETEWDEFTGRVYTNFYYDEHDHTTHNLITVVSRSLDEIRVSVEGRIRAENSSMQTTRIVAEARLTPGQEHFGLGGFMRKDLPLHKPPHGAIIQQPEQEA
jgi:hypothetical protein